MPSIRLISREFSWWRNALGIVATAVLVALIPLFIVVKLLMTPFKRPTRRTAAEVANYLRDYINDCDDDDGNWDAFVCIPIADPALENIRQRAAAVRLPLEAEGQAELEGLLAEAERLS